MTGTVRDLLFTPAQVADQLGLHVKTVRRYIHEGQLEAVRVGKRYRVTRASLEALSGTSLEPPRSPRASFSEASSIVSIDGLDRDAANRITVLLVASSRRPPSDAEPMRVETLYYPQRQRLKVVVNGDLAATMATLALINTLLHDQP